VPPVTETSPLIDVEPEITLVEDLTAANEELPAELSS
jgi:hypothetical protein